jgi:hypothetical protein
MSHPRSCELLRETQFAWPPAKKNNAMTSPVQVMGHSPGITATTFWFDDPPSSQIRHDA